MQQVMFLTQATAEQRRTIESATGTAHKAEHDFRNWVRFAIGVEHRPRDHPCWLPNIDAQREGLAVDCEKTTDTGAGTQEHTCLST
jgi:hypothetical protein